jgi:hypothetical protein
MQTTPINLLENTDNRTHNFDNMSSEGKKALRDVVTTLVNEGFMFKNIGNMMRTILKGRTLVSNISSPKYSDHDKIVLSEIAAYTKAVELGLESMTFELRPRISFGLAEGSGTKFAEYLDIIEVEIVCALTIQGEFGDDFMGIRLVDVYFKYFETEEGKADFLDPRSKTMNNYKSWIKLQSKTVQQVGKTRIEIPISIIKESKKADTTAIKDLRDREKAEIKNSEQMAYVRGVISSIDNNVALADSEIVNIYDILKSPLYAKNKNPDFVELRNTAISKISPMIVVIDSK